MLRAGDKDFLTKTFTTSHVWQYAGLTGDNNPVHLDEDYAAKTPFGRCIVHGKLVEGLVSAVLGTKLPGPMSVFQRSSIEYLAPVYIDDEVTAVVIVRGPGAKPHWVELDVYAYVDGNSVLSGEATIVLPKDKVKWID